MPQEVPQELPQVPAQGPVTVPCMSDAARPAGEPDFEPGQIVTVFRSRLRPDAGQDYVDRATEMARLAATMPGLVDVTAFTADDGERLTLVTFADEPSQRAWREHAEHRLAQRAGRDRFYAEYSIQVCETVRTRRFVAQTA
jgi:heme-degrading monooxygenase HmoA